MPVYDYAQGEITLPLESTREIKVHASAKTELVLYGVSGSTRIPLETGKNIRFKGTLSDNFEKIAIVAHGKGKFGFMFHERIVTEPILNDEHPPTPQIPKSDNLVAQIHRVAKQANAMTRGPLEPDDDVPFFSRYEVDDDDYRFEEDMIESLSSSQQKSQDSEPLETDVAGASETSTQPPAADKPSGAPLESPQTQMAAE